MEYIAHYIGQDKKGQSVKQHLNEVASLTSSFTGKIGLPSLGRLEGLLHDFGKYSEDFQIYIRSAEGKLEPDMEPVNAVELKGKIDHSSAGAQIVWEYFKDIDPGKRLLAQTLALSVASHHSGLIDCLSPEGEDKFSTRMVKNKVNTHLDEARKMADTEILDQISGLLQSTYCFDELKRQVEVLSLGETSHEIREFYMGLLERFIFSALIDADRLNSSGRENMIYPHWDGLVERFEQFLLTIKQNNWVDKIRSKVSNACKDFSSREKGLYQLTVPTGGAKTLSSLRFGLHHAFYHKMDRIIFVVPYTSIIDQNAAVARSILEISEQERNNIVLEHHSNLTREQDTWQNRLLSENWDAPVIFTTMVQFLETLFAGRTRAARRMHRLANAVIIFDEVQALPVKTVHLFNNAINFLIKQCGSTVVFCTATQPLLNEVNPKKGAARLTDMPEMAPDTGTLFKDLRRVELVDKRKIGGWIDTEVAQLICHEAIETGSALAIVNTKVAAKALYDICKIKTTDVLHLSTNMCTAHRMEIIKSIKQKLEFFNSETKPLVCISTQLIEAGVDIDFGSVVRYLAGLDSMSQAAGRCNRNGRRSSGKTYIVNPLTESLDKLPEIKIGKEVAERVLDEFSKNPNEFDCDLLSPKAMRRYYEYYFFNRANDMSYRLSSKYIGRDDELLNLLSTNVLSVEAYKRANKSSPTLYLRQSFKSAGNSFEVIDSPTDGIVVPYGEKGKRIIADLCAVSDIKEKFQLLREAQHYSVNLFPQDMEKLSKTGNVYETQKESGILYLDERAYDKNLGVVINNDKSIPFLNT